MAKTYSNGKTAATLEAIANRIDWLCERHEALPCVDHADKISRMAASGKYQWAMLIAIFSSILVIGGMVIRHLG